MTRTNTSMDMTRLRVLLVDDNAALRGALRVSLQAFGCAEVLEADTVDRALDVLRAKPVDLLITDWKMKPRDGLDLVRTLRRPAGSPAPFLPIIMLSAYSQEDRITEARQSGVHAFLVKPFTAASLASVIQETLRLTNQSETDAVPALACTN
ncbi:response regulator [Maricaulis parjimensis]|uniref:response regulator n=1 Tax=Maricaulis parjimensis TaxID=144023 RepID=UPI00193A7235|nr:response regulator [Maricaulis parjimensis]